MGEKFYLVLLCGGVLVLLCGGVIVLSSFGFRAFGTLCFGCFFQKSDDFF